MIVTALPRAQHDSFRTKIERQILEIESRIVPGLAKATERVMRDQVQELYSKLKPQDDKRNPSYYRKRKPRLEKAPCLLWSAEDWAAAKWGARHRAGGVCEICKAGPAEIPRIHTHAPDVPLTREHVEVVCTVCADQHPRFEVVSHDE